MVLLLLLWPRMMPAQEALVELCMLDARMSIKKTDYGVSLSLFFEVVLFKQPFYHKHKQRKERRTVTVRFLTGKSGKNIGHCH